MKGREVYFFPGRFHGRRLCRIVRSQIAWAMKMPRFSAKDTRDFTIGRRDGSENIASKMKLRSFGLYHDYSNSLALSNVGEPSRS